MNFRCKFWRRRSLDSIATRPHNRYNLTLILASHITALICIGFSPRLKAEDLSKPNLSPVVDGVLDLAHWDRLEAIPLVGKFWLFNDSLLNPNDFNPALLASASLISVPDFKIPESFQGTAILKKTYVIKLDHIPIHAEMALSLGRVAWASRSYLLQPGKSPFLIMETGQIADQNPEESIPTYEAHSSNMLPDLGEQAYLLIQVASKTFGSNTYWRPAIVEPFVLGPKKSILQQEKFRLLESFFVLGIYALMALNSFSIFLQRREDKGSLMLALLGLGLILRYLGTEGLLAKLTSEPHQWIFLSNNFCLIFGQQFIMTVLMHFQKETFPNYVHRYWLWLANGGLALVLGLQIFLSPIDYLTSWLPLSLLALTLGLYIIYIAIKTCIKGENSAYLGLAGFIIVAVAHIYDGIIQSLRLPLPFLGQYGFASLLFCQSLIVGQRFAFAYRRTKVLSDELQVKNDELEIQQDQIRLLNHDLQVYNATLEQRVEEKTRDISSILRSIRQGILAINDAEGGLAEEHSLFLETMLNTQDISGRNVIDLCFKGSSLDADQLDQLRNAISAAIGEDELAFEVNLAAFPRNFEIKGESVKSFEVDWNPILDHGLVQKLLVVIKDVTDLKQLQSEALQQAIEMQAIAEIINIPLDKFTSVIASASHLLNANNDIFEKKTPLDSPTIDYLFRNMHTLKGLARSYRLKKITEQVHLAEENYKLLKLGHSIPLATLHAELNAIIHSFRDIKRLNDEKLGRNSLLNDKHIIIDKQQMEENFKSLRAIDLTMMQNTDRSKIEDLKNLFKKIIYSPLERVMAPLLDSLKDLATSLGKLEPEIEFKDEGISLNRSTHEMICNVFGHLLRNSLDHGIEHPELRRSRNKAERGKLSFHIGLHRSLLRIVFFDDGAGLDLVKIKHKADSQGLLPKTAHPTAFDLAQCIMHPGFSTTDSVTNISGRGIGMDAVRGYIEEQNGQFEILLDDPYSEDLHVVPAKFMITLPVGTFEVIV